MNVALRLGLILLGVVAPVLGVAQAKVGPRDGMVVEALPALAMPGLMAEETLPDLTLPTLLEERGLWAAASLEWQRLLPTVRGAERLTALDSLARLAFRQGAAAAGEASLAELAARGGMVSAATLAARAPTLAGEARQEAFMDLATAFPQDEASVGARWAEVWAQAAATGRVHEAYGVPEATELQARLAALEAAQRQRYLLAVGAAVIPGAGYAVLGDYGAALALALSWCVLGWAFYAACRRRHYAYALAFAVPWVALWLNAPVGAGWLAEQQAVAARHAAMAGWQDLRPTFVPATSTP